MKKSITFGEVFGMKKQIRGLALVLALLLLTLSLAACRDEEDTKAPVVAYAAGGCEIRYDELRYVTMTQKDKLERKYGQGIWDTPETAELYRAELEAAVYDVLRNHYAVLAACQQFGISVDLLESEGVLASVETSIQSAIRECGGQERFEQLLAATYMTENFMRFSLAVTELENELLYKLTTELSLIEGDVNRFMAWMQDGNAVYVQHVFIENDVGEDVAQNRATAQNIAAQLKSGEKKITDIIGLAINEETLNLDPYYVVRDVYTPEIERAVLALQTVGSVSEVVETENGFYVFVRIAERFAEDGTNLTAQAKADALLTSYQWARVEAYVQAAKEQVAIEWNDYGKTLDLVYMQ